MTSLERDAYGTLPLSQKVVERMYADSDKHPLSDRKVDIRRLCLSHTRLIAEYLGLENLWLKTSEPDSTWKLKWAGEPNPHRAAA